MSLKAGPECLALGHKTQAAVSQAISALRQRMPFLVGIDSDNGSEFINDTLYRTACLSRLPSPALVPTARTIKLMLSRRNWSVVRHTVGYDRLETEDDAHLVGWVADFGSPAAKLEDNETHTTASEAIIKDESTIKFFASEYHHCHQISSNVH